MRAVGDAFMRADDLLFFSPTVAAVLEQLFQAWRQVRVQLLVPLLRAAVVLCMVLSVIALTEKVFLGMVSSVMKVLRRRPSRLYRCDPIVQDEEAGSTAFPMVLVQIPMYNEKEVWLYSEFCHWQDQVF